MTAKDYNRIVAMAHYRMTRTKYPEIPADTARALALAFIQPATVRRNGRVATYRRTMRQEAR